MNIRILFIHKHIALSVSEKKKRLSEKAASFVDFDFFLIYFVYFVEKTLKKISTKTHERRKQIRKKM